MSRQVQALWAQKYQSPSVAQDAIDIFIRHIGRDAVISTACYQTEADGDYVASVRYWEVQQ